MSILSLTEAKSTTTLHCGVGGAVLKRAVKEDPGLVPSIHMSVLQPAMTPVPEGLWDSSGIRRPCTRHTCTQKVFFVFKEKL